MSKEYRVTWRHELFILAENDQEAREIWETIDLSRLYDETHDFVEEISFECVDDDYRNVPEQP